MMALLDTAVAFHDAGCCPVPVKADGSKAPAGFWKQYQTERPSREQLDTWFAAGAYDGLGIICGAVSGNVEMLEFEGRAIAEGYFRRFMAALADHGMKELGDRIADGYTERTPSGGLHFVFRVDGQARGNTKLARRPSTPEELEAWRATQQAGIDAETDDAKRAKRQKALDGITRGEQVPQVLVETRGEGGFVITAPSAGRTHETGKAWTLLAGSPATITTITEDERDALYAVASLLDEMPAADPPPPRGAPGPTIGDSRDDVLRPGDDFNQRADWADILGPHGWTHVGNCGAGRFWRRPGKNRGISATTGTRGDTDGLYVFSSSTAFDTEKPYTKFGAFAVLEHGGDYAAAARALRAQGYGGDMPHDDDGIDDLIAEPGPSQTGGDSPKGDTPQPPPARPDIDITYEPTAIVDICKALNKRTIPATYVRNGRVVEIATPSGVEPSVTIGDVTPDRLRRLLARHAHTFKVKNTPKTSYEVPTSPATSTCAAVLSDRVWPGLQPLAGVVHAPAIRADGTVLQAAGYDEATGLYLAPDFDVPHVPDVPTLAEITAAKRFLLEQVLVDFCFDTDASRANYVALLVTPMLRLFIGGLLPFGVISAATRGSGKTYLTAVLGALYGCHMTTWQKKDTETNKVITTVLKDSTKPCVVFDNVDPYDSVDHPSLAMLLTSTIWDGRILGTSDSYHGANDRLWLCTGNNTVVGGDIASRSVFVRLDPQMERPELRTGFTIPNFEWWLRDEGNRARLLAAVLTLTRAWIAAGAPHISKPMRNFTKWAECAGGFVTWLGLPDFLGNVDELTDGSDEEEISTAAFLRMWFGKFGTQPKTAVELVDSARGDFVMGQTIDAWQGTFPSRADDKPYSAKGLGRFLSARRDRIFGSLRLVREMDKHEKVARYRVEEAAESGKRAAA